MLVVVVVINQHRPRRRVAKAQAYIPPRTKFEGRSTTQDSFVAPQQVAAAGVTQ